MYTGKLQHAGTGGPTPEAIAGLRLRAMAALFLTGPPSHMHQIQKPIAGSRTSSGRTIPDLRICRSGANQPLPPMSLSYPVVSSLRGAEDHTPIEVK